MTQTVTIKTPPTLFVSEGPPQTFELPLIPKPNSGFSAVFGILHLCVALLVFAVIVLPAFSGLVTALVTWSISFELAAGVAVFAGFSWLFVGLFGEMGLWFLMPLFVRSPVLEIREEGLVDRRALKRLVRWEEFEDIGHNNRRMSYLTGPVDYSFKLKDGSLRRISPNSWMFSVMYGRSRVAVNPFGFDLPAAAIVNVILAMISNAHTPQRHLRA